MMNTFRKNGGFTLMELLVTIVTASIVTLAATTILLLGIRINRQSIDTASRQTTTRILLTTLEKLATEGTIEKIQSEPDSWQVIGEDDKVLLSFDSFDQKVYTGPADGSEGAVLMEEVYASHIFLADNGLLEISVETEEGSYYSAVYCRANVISNTTDETGKQEIEDLLKPETDGESGIQPEDAQKRFLRALASQYAINTSAGSMRNPGLILDSSGKSTGKYFSEWYVGSYDDNPGWNGQTPWCACYISWALMNSVEGADVKVDFGTNTNGFANVDSFMNFLESKSLGHDWKNSGSYTPVAGDLIFFDWTINNVQNPEHIGAVIKVEGGYVYTIEGNSAGRVAVRKYGLNDPRIIGYGILEWKS